MPDSTGQVRGKILISGVMNEFAVCNSQEVATKRKSTDGSVFC